MVLVVRLVAQDLEVGHDLQDLVLVEALAEGLHGAGPAGIDDLEAAAIGAGAGALGAVADQARADPAGAVLEMAGLAELRVDLLARLDRGGIARVGVLGRLVELLARPG